MRKIFHLEIKSENSQLPDYIHDDTLIVVGEWEQDKDYNSLLVGVATARVDGKKIKPDTWYTAKNGKLVISE